VGGFELQYAAGEEIFDAGIALLNAIWKI